MKMIEFPVKGTEDGQDSTIGLTPIQHTWFETALTQDPVSGEMVGGNHVRANPGDRFPIDYPDKRFVSQHVRDKRAQIIEVDDEPTGGISDEAKPFAFDVDTEDGD